MDNLYFFIHTKKKKLFTHKIKNILSLLVFQLIDHLMAGMEDIVGKTGNYHVRDKFKRFDNKFIRPLILKHVQV